MPFEVVECVTKAVDNKRASISYKRSASAKSRDPKPRLVIGIPKTVADGFKFMEGQQFILQIGTGADKGKGRIVQCAAGGIAARVLKGGAVFRFGFVPMLGEDAAEKEAADVKQVNGGFEIKLPAWFKADEPTTPAKPRVK